MESVIESLKAWQPHPFIDHFTVALILVGILTDLVASIFSSRLWLRYMALSLMILGAIGAEASSITGGWEAGRVWDSVTGPGKAVLERHAWWGDKLPWVFGGLALWRLALQFVSFVAPSRPLYLLAAVVAGGAIVYQGHLGSKMVYDYGIGTDLLVGGQTAAPSPSEMVSPSAPETAATPTPTPSLAPLPMPSVAPTNTSSPNGSMSAAPSPSMSGSSSPSATPTASPSPGAKNL